MTETKTREDMGRAWRGSRPVFDGKHRNDRQPESPAVAALRERFKKVKIK